MITVSYVTITMKRRNEVERSLDANFKNAGYPISELVHIDNGSGPEFLDWFTDRYAPSLQVRYAENAGIYRGYNTGMALARSSHIAYIDSDIIMPDGWLAAFVEAHQKIPNTGYVTCFSREERMPERTLADCMHRLKGHPHLVNGVKIVEATPHGSRLFSREFLMKVGYLRECFGLYGYGDVEYMHRIKKVAKDEGYINYVLPDLDLAIHLPDVDDSIVIDGMTYREFKTANQGRDKAEIISRARELGFPPYNPFARIERNLTDDES